MGDNDDALLEAAEEWDYSAGQLNMVNFFKGVFLFKMHNKHYFNFDKIQSWPTLKLGFIY